MYNSSTLQVDLRDRLSEAIMTPARGQDIAIMLSENAGDSLCCFWRVFVEARCDNSSQICPRRYAYIPPE